MERTRPKRHRIRGLNRLDSATGLSANGGGAMFVQIEGIEEKRAAQTAMERSLKAALPSVGVRKMGFPGGSRESDLISSGPGQLWCAFEVSKGKAGQRRWNAFGVYDDTRSVQAITVEINIPVDSNTALVAGLFGQDPATGRVYLMHDGGVGGGKPGVGRDAFLAWSKATTEDVARSDGPPRQAIVIGDVEASDLHSRIWRFTQLVRDFKDAVANGELETEELRRAIAGWSEFHSESSGRRSWIANRKVDFVSYHGDVVEMLYSRRKAISSASEQILNSPLIDLYVRDGEAVTEIYEVKTSLERQALYTAVGQIVTHSVGAAQGVRRVLVIPEGAVPEDLERCFETLDLEVRRFRLTAGETPAVELVGI